ncbi:MAG: DUF3298 domain-containing protein [Caldisericia bacterium]|nr:DUF3298 domain-containing protein [Caldisericia bacterium]
MSHKVFKKIFTLITSMFFCSLLLTNCSQKKMNSVKEDTIPSTVSISEKNIENESSDERLIFHGTIPYFFYPQCSDTENLLNNIVKSFIEKEILQWTETGLEMLIEYETLYISKEKCSVSFTFSVDLGGAHPNPYAKSLNVDFTSITKIENDDLFRDDVDYLGIVSKYSKLAVTKHLNENSVASNNRWIEDGTAPIEENYQSLSIIPVGLLVIFSPYQIASYADGFQSIVIPYEDIQDILLFKPNTMGYP